jgi:hypothetical protein
MTALLFDVSAADAPVTVGRVAAADKYIGGACHVRPGVSI